MRYAYRYIVVGWLVTLLNGVPAQAHNKLCERIIVDKNILQVIVNPSFKQQYLLDDFVAEYDESIDLAQLDHSLVIVPFILSVISLVWESGEVWEIDALDRELANALPTIKEVYKLFYPDVSWEGQLVVQELIDNKRSTDDQSAQSPAIANLFSGGLDSVHTSFAHRTQKQLLLTYWGFSAEVPLHNSERWQMVQQQSRRYAQVYHHENSFVRSNFRSYINVNALHERHPTMKHWVELCQEAISQAGLAMPVLYLRGVMQLYIPSARTDDYPYPWGAHPFIDNNIRCAGVQVTHDGYDCTRQEKIRQVVQWCGDEKLSRPPLIVCRRREHRQCTTCEKCLQTMTGLLIENQLPEDYGFARSVERVISLVRLRIESKRLRLNHPFAWHWKNMQRRIAQIASQANGFITYDLDTVDYLTWLETINFDELHTDAPVLHPVDWAAHAHFLSNLANTSPQSAQ